jgi:5-formyltetrahydrofolate cyclo-ligase
MSSSTKSSPLEFFETADWAELHLGAFGIGEPRPRPGAASLRPDVVLVPGVAFSHDAHRLGFGAGYYDHTLEFWAAAGLRHSIHCLGLAYDFQLVTELPREPHDHVLDYVVTEENIFKKGPST